ncbi:threonine-phosphate decarboxylase [Oscillospiraceae bacterium MB08-C2-2]|nr:threonine-phosphate decarboxylase [Oscillospiraceae bacterium MB08-C2-2]
MKLVHGGDVLGFEEKYGRKPLDFSVNTNPLGMPPGAKAAATRALEEAGAYPDPLCRRLTEALSKKEEIPPEAILFGNGAADLIFRLAYALRPKSAMVTAPGFAEYALALGAAGCPVQRHFLREDEGFCVTPRLLEEIQPGLEMLFLCEPNNPTGQTTEPSLLKATLERCRRTGTRLVVDECFVGFLENPQEHTLKGYLTEYPNLVILGAFTKLYAMAGLRLGTCFCTDPSLLEGMKKASQPWPVSSVAQAAGLAALEEPDYLARTREMIAAEKEYLRQGLAEAGIMVLGSEANYLFFKSPIVDFWEKMAREGILIRGCENFPGLSAGYFRIGIKTRADNQRFLQELQTILGQEDGGWQNP